MGGYNATCALPIVAVGTIGGLAAVVAISLVHFDFGT